MPKMLTFIAGVPHNAGAREKLAELEDNALLRLVREPANTFDKNAVAVYSLDGVKLGYVPKVDSPTVAKVLDSNRKHRCRRDALVASTGIDISWKSCL